MEQNPIRVYLAHISDPTADPRTLGSTPFLTQAKAEQHCQAYLNRVWPDFHTQGQGNGGRPPTLAWVPIPWRGNLIDGRLGREIIAHAFTLVSPKVELGFGVSEWLL